MASITYANKSQAVPYDSSRWNAQDANEVKTVVNQKDDLILGTKTSHGFVVGEGIYQDSTGWHRASNADNTIASRVDGVVISVTDANNFVVGKKGAKFTVSLLANTEYFLGSSSPNYTATEATVVGQIRQVLFVTAGATEGTVVISEPFEITNASSSIPGTDSVTNTMLGTDIKVGSLNSLTTTNKSSVQAAINELKSILDGIVSSGSGGSGAGTGIDKDYISLPVLSTPGTFTATAVSDSQVNLTWTDISGEVNYIIQRSTNQTSGYSTISSPAASSTAYSDTGLTESTQYFYRLKAVGNAWTTRDSQWTFANATTTSSGGGAPTVEQEILLNFINQYRFPDEYSGVQGIADTGGTAVAAGTAGMNNVKDIDGVTTTVDFALTSAGLSAAGSPSNGNDPSSDTVFGKEFVAGISWYLLDGTTFKISGLAASRQYKLYFWANAFGWESSTVNFEANGVTTSNVTTGNNYGSATGDPLQDAALRVITVTSDGSGEINGIAHYVSGYGAVSLTALYIQRLSA
jgi:hypothetical protein